MKTTFGSVVRTDSPIGAQCPDCRTVPSEAGAMRQLCDYHTGWRAGNEVPNVEIERMEEAVDMFMLEPRPDFDREIPAHQFWADGWEAALSVLKHRVAGDMRHPADYLLPGGRAPRPSQVLAPSERVADIPDLTFELNVPEETAAILFGTTDDAYRDFDRVVGPSYRSAAGGMEFPADVGSKQRWWRKRLWRKR